MDDYRIGYIDGVASRDAEVAKLKDDNEYLYIAAIERDQLREQVTELKQQLYNLQFEPVLLSEWQQLEQERDHLRDLLRPFAALLQEHNRNGSDDKPMFQINGAKITRGDLRRALAATDPTSIRNDT